MSIVSFIGYYISKESIKEQTFSKLTTIRNSKAQEISRYFSSLTHLTHFIAKNKHTIEAYEHFDQAFTQLKNGKSLTKSEYDRLNSIRNDWYIDNYLKNTHQQRLTGNQFLNYIPQNKESILLQTLNHDTKLNLAEIDSYKLALKEYHDFFQEFEKQTDFGDVLLINSKSGDIIYATNSTCDLGGNILKDSLSKTNLSKLFQKMRYSKQANVAVVDYESYFPSFFDQKAFMACPIIKNGENIGVISLRIPIDSINKIMSFNSNWQLNGLGKTGEIYLFGNHFKMRSNSRFLIEDPDKFLSKLQQLGYNQSQLNEIKRSNSTIKNIEIRTRATKQAINGKTKIEIIKDYRGEEVLCAYMPLNILQFKWGLNAKMDTSEAFENIEILRELFIYCFIGAFLLIILLSFTLSSAFTKPINALTYSANELSKGNFDTLIKVSQNDEIGMLATSFSEMRSKIVQLIDKLRSANGSLEEKQKEIFDSIRYARKIQDTILAKPELLNENLPEYFIYFNPKDIVSGDFYWGIKTEASERESTSGTLESTSPFYLAVCDSTGHGIPGAFMSLLNVSFLNEAIKEKGIDSPDQIFNFVRHALIQTFHGEENKDGMDGVIIRYERGNSQLTYSAGNCKPILIRDGELNILETDKMAIGKGINNAPFQLFSIEIKKNDTLYLISDGYPDQFGGVSNKKYKYKKLYDFLLQINSLSLSDQKQALDLEFEQWKGNFEQTDDVMIVGIRF